MVFNKIHMTVEISKEFSDFLEQLASEEATTKVEIMRRAFGILEIYKKQKQAGNTHIGFTSDPSKLDVELVGVLKN